MSTTTTTRTMPTPSKPHPSSSSTPATGSISLAASSDSSTDATQWAHPDEIRTRFSKAMSTMYKQEVPLYGDLLKLVKDVNEATMRKDPLLRAQLDKRHELGEWEVSFLPPSLPPHPPPHADTRGQVTDLARWWGGGEVGRREEGKDGSKGDRVESMRRKKDQRRMHQHAMLLCAEWTPDRQTMTAQRSVNRHLTD